MEAAEARQKKDQERVRRAELLISNLLRYGVLASLAVIALGVTLTFARHPEYVHDPAMMERVRHVNGHFPRTLGAVGRGLATLQGEAVVMLGLLLLIATPVARVALSLLVFARLRDRRFVLITAVVLALLLASFLLGKAAG